MVFMCLSLFNSQEMISKGNQLEIIFSSNHDAKDLSHVQLFILHSIGKFPIKMVQKQCKWKLSNGYTKCYAWTHSPSRSKWDVFKISPLIVNRTIKEPLWIKLLSFSPMFRISSNCSYIHNDFSFVRYFISINYTSFSTFSRKSRSRRIQSQSLFNN